MGKAALEALGGLKLHNHHEDSESNNESGMESNQEQRGDVF